MPDNAPRGRVFDDPKLLGPLTANSIITNGIQLDVLEVQTEEAGQPRAAAGMALYIYGRPNNVSSGRYEKLHVLGLDVAAKLAAAILVVGTNTWGPKFSGPVDAMLRDPATLPITESGIVLPGSGIASILKRRPQ